MSSEKIKRLEKEVLEKETVVKVLAEKVSQSKESKRVNINPVDIHELNIGSDSYTSEPGASHEPFLMDRWTVDKMLTESSGVNSGIGREDVNHPLQIAESYSELFDSEWTDAYEVLERHYSERDIIQKLLDIILVAYDECKAISTTYFFETIQVYIEQSDTMKGTCKTSCVVDPMISRSNDQKIFVIATKKADAIYGTRTELPDALKLQIIEFRKYKAVKTCPYIQKLLFERIPLLNEPELQMQCVKK